MAKILKIGISFFAILILLIITALVLLITVVNPNRFKPYITAQITKYTGRPMHIAGDLSWTMYPYMGIKVNEISIENTPDIVKKSKENVFAKIDHITVGVKILPLIHGQIESNGLVLKGVSLNLFKFSNGTNNWEDLQQLSASNSSNQVAARGRRLRNDADDVPNTGNDYEVNVDVNPGVNRPSDINNPNVLDHPGMVRDIKDPADRINSGENTKKSSLSIAIRGVAIEDANINFNDEASKQRYQLSHFDLQANNIRLNQGFPVKASFQLNSSGLQGNFILDSDITVDLAKQTYTLKETDLRANVTQDGKTYQLSTRTNIVINLAEQKIQLNDLQGSLGNVRWSGVVNVTDLDKSPQTSGKIQTKAFQLSDLLAALSQKVEGMPQANNVQASVDFNVGKEGINAKTAITVKDIVVNNLKLTNLAVDSTFKNGILTAMPISAKLYQGDLVGDAKVNLNGKQPEIALNAKLVNVQAEPLLKDLSSGKDQKLKFSGVGNIQLHVTTVGASATEIKNHLNGNTTFSFNNGLLEGVDVGYLIDSANALANQQSLPGNNTNQTHFGNLSGTAQIQNGVITNQDLAVEAPRFVTKGKGKIDLVNSQIDYLLEAKVKKTTTEQKNNLFNLYGLTIPIHISGDLSNPSIRTNTGSILTQVAQQKVEKQKTKIVAKIKDKIQDKIKDKLPGDAGKLLDSFLGQ